MDAGQNYLADFDSLWDVSELENIAVWICYWRGAIYDIRVSDTERSIHYLLYSNAMVRARPPMPHAFLFTYSRLTTLTYDKDHNDRAQFKT